MDQRRMRGLSGVTIVAVLATTALAGCSSSSTASSNPETSASTGTAASAEATQPTTSKVLNVTLDVSSWSSAIQAKIPEFESATGIKVQATAYSDDQIQNQFKVKLSANSEDIDVMMIRPLQDMALFQKNGWLADLTADTGANADWDWQDFQPASRSAVTRDGKVLSVPVIGSETEVLYYRKDLLAKAGLDIPKTFDEFRAAMQKIVEQNPGMYGFVGRGQAATAVTQFSSYLYGYGGDWAKDGKAVVNSAEAKQAYAFYGGLLKDFGPPGASNLDWPTAMGLFTQGKAAFFTEDSSNTPEATDPAKSAFASQIGFAAIPAGPTGAHPYCITPFSLSISAFSTNHDAAWKFVEWATSKAMVAEMQKEGVTGPRASVPIESGLPADLAEVIKTQSQIGVGYDRPQVINVGKARDIVGAPIVVAINGGDVSAAADKANADFQALIDSEAN